MENKLDELDNELDKQVLDIRCSVLRDYIEDLEESLTVKTRGLGLAEQLEEGKDGQPVNTADAVVMGMNDWLYRRDIGYLESELTKTKYDYSIAYAELLSLSGIDTKEPESKYDIEKIKQIPIVDFIKKFTVIKNGNMAICPIHREKTPSLHIYPATNSWFCFGHNSGGSVIDFMMQLNGYSINEALNDLHKLI